MCSIFGILDIKDSSKDYRSIAIRQSQKQRHRGPDWSGVWDTENAVLVHERLAIVDIETGEKINLHPENIQEKYTELSQSFFNNLKNKQN